MKLLNMHEYYDKVAAALGALVSLFTFSKMADLLDAWTLNFSPEKLIALCWAISVAGLGAAASVAGKRGMEWLLDRLKKKKKNY